LRAVTEHVWGGFVPASWALRSLYNPAGPKPRQASSKPGRTQAGIGSRGAQRPASISFSRWLLANHQRCRMRRPGWARLRHGRGWLCSAGEPIHEKCAQRNRLMSSDVAHVLTCLAHNMRNLNLRPAIATGSVHGCWKQGPRLRRRRKPQPEKPPPMMSPIKSLFASNRLGHLSGMMLPALGSSPASASLLQPGAPAKLGGSHSTLHAELSCI
jgi:hypothetical protein